MFENVSSGHKEEGNLIYWASGPVSRNIDVILFGLRNCTLWKTVSMGFIREMGTEATGLNNNFYQYEIPSIQRCSKAKITDTQIFQINPQGSLLLI